MVSSAQREALGRSNDVYSGTIYIVALGWCHVEYSSNRMVKLS